MGEVTSLSLFQMSPFASAFPRGFRVAVCHAVHLPFGRNFILRGPLPRESVADHYTAFARLDVRNIIGTAAVSAVHGPAVLFTAPPGGYNNGRLHTSAARRKPRAKSRRKELCL